MNLIALACAACYGQSDSPLATGMNWGILSLLGIIGAVLIGIAGFFVYLARRSASRMAAAGAQSGAVSSSTPTLATPSPALCRSRV